MDHYHLTMDRIAKLTDRTIHEVYFHARTKEGAISIPVGIEGVADKPATIESTLADLQYLLDLNLITEENYRQCVEDAKRKFNDGKPV